MDGQNPQLKENMKKQRWLPLTSPPTSPVTLAMRPALGELPAFPMNQIPKAKNTKPSPAILPPTPKNQPLSPPVTSEKMGEMPGGIRPYASKYELHEKLGYGVWSDVYRASEITEPIFATPNLLPSPPISPTNRSAPGNSRVLAVKKASRRDAYKILEEEAKILTLLHSCKEASAYLVGFHGFDIAQHSIIMDSVPLSLENHTRLARKQPISTKTMLDPIIGAEQWANLAENLISGLAFLRSKGCVHGDIKPSNILLRVDENGKCTPLYCDFSSSHITTSTTSPDDIEEVSAVTTDYTSPELLESLHSKNVRAVATYASDVFALAVTLIFAAIGESPYAGARIEMQKLVMAKEGLPLEYARVGEGASRVMKGKAVAKALEGGLKKGLEARLEVVEWREVVREVVMGWKEGGWARGG